MLHMAFIITYHSKAKMFKCFICGGNAWILGNEMLIVFLFDYHLNSLSSCDHANMFYLSIGNEMIIFYSFDNCD